MLHYNKRDKAIKPRLVSSALLWFRVFDQFEHGTRTRTHAVTFMKAQQLGFMV